jgi:hypothetical protein
MVWRDARLHEPTHKRRPSHVMKVDAFGEVHVRDRPCRQTTPPGVRSAFDTVGTHGGNDGAADSTEESWRNGSTVSPHGHDNGYVVFYEGRHERVYGSVHLL